MRPSLLAIYLALAVSVVVHAEDRYLAAGVPASDREWRSSDYRTFVKLVTSKKVPLPMLSDPEGVKILRRFCNLENMDYWRNKTLPLTLRMPDFLETLQVTSQVAKQYGEKAIQGDKVGGELSQLLTFMLHVSASGIALADEFLPTMPKDDTYATRIEGLAKMKHGLTSVFVGAYVSIAEDKIYSDEERADMLHAVAATSERFAAMLPTDTKQEMRGKYSKLNSRFKALLAQKDIETITTNLK